MEHRDHYLCHSQYLQLWPPCKLNKKYSACPTNPYKSLNSLDTKMKSTRFSRKTILLQLLDTLTIRPSNVAWQQNGFEFPTTTTTVYCTTSCSARVYHKEPAGQ